MENTPFYGYYLTDFDHRRKKSRYNMYGNGGQIDPSQAIGNSNNNVSQNKIEPEEPVYDGILLPEVTITSKAMPWQGVGSNKVGTKKLSKQIP